MASAEEGMKEAPYGKRHTQRRAAAPSPGKWVAQQDHPDSLSNREEGGREQPLEHCNTRHRIPHSDGQVFTGRFRRQAGRLGGQMCTERESLHYAGHYAPGTLLSGPWDVGFQCLSIAADAPPREARAEPRQRGGLQQLSRVPNGVDRLSARNPSR